jgi:hypothetical protein
LRLGILPKEGIVMRLKMKKGTGAVLPGAKKALVYVLVTTLAAVPCTVSAQTPTINWDRAISKAIAGGTPTPASGQGSGSTGELGTEEKVGIGVAISGSLPLGIGIAMISTYLQDDCDTGPYNHTPTCNHERNVMGSLLLIGAAAAVAGLALFADGAKKREARAAAYSGPGVQNPPTTGPGIGPGIGSSASADSQAAQEAIDQIRSGDHGDMPTPSIAGSSYGGRATMTVTNSTAFTLYLYYAGPTAGTRILEPGTSGTIPFAPGRYELAARVSAPNVRPFYGLEDFAGAAYTETFYIR